jgi:hypothetical protein
MYRDNMAATGKVICHSFMLAYAMSGQNVAALSTCKIWLTNSEYGSHYQSGHNMVATLYQEGLYAAYIQLIMLHMVCLENNFKCTALGATFSPFFV